MTKQEVIDSIRKDGSWHVRVNGDKIILDRVYCRKPIEFSLKSLKDNKYEVEHPNYIFISSVSHFKAIKQDTRLSLSKSCLGSAIKMLKRNGIWLHVINRNFIQVNDNNRNSDKTKVNNELKSLLRIEQK